MEHTHGACCADSGKLEYLRWENDNCALCDSSNCLEVGQVYEGERVYACASKQSRECEQAQGQQDGNNSTVSYAITPHK